MDDTNELDIQTTSFKEKCANNAYYIVIAILVSIYSPGEA